LLKGYDRRASVRIVIAPIGCGFPT
jgi:hypothetical protein